MIGSWDFGTNIQIKIGFNARLNGDPHPADENAGLRDDAFEIKAEPILYTNGN